MKRLLLISLLVFPLFAGYGQTCDSITFHYVEGLKAAHAQGDRVAAAEWFERALADDPDNIGVLAAAAANIAPADPVRALEYGKKAYAIDSTDMWLREQLTRLYLANRLYDEAEALSPNEIEVLLALADHSRSRGDDARFLDVAKRLMQHDDIAPEIKASIFEDITRDRTFYGRNYLRLLDMARTLMLENPTDYRTVGIYAGVLLAGGQTEQGVEVYKNYISDTTSFVEPFKMIMDGETYLKRTDSLRRWADIAIARFPSDATLHLRRGNALAYLGDDREALGSYREALRRAPDDSIRSMAHAFIGSVYATQERTNQSIKHYNRAIGFDPDNVFALNNLAYTFAEAGRELPRALRMAERVMALEPENATYIDTYGYILFRLGRLEEAKKILRHAMSLADDPEIMNHYAEVLQALGEEFMAEYYREKAKENERE